MNDVIDISTFNTIGFDVIIYINELIKKIDELSFNVRLRALNSLISAKKNNRNEFSGFSAISFELIHFSDKLEKKAFELRVIIHDILLLSTNQKKYFKKLLLIQKPLFYIQDMDNSIKEKFQLIKIMYDENLKNFEHVDNEVNKDISQLTKKIKEIFLLCRAGKVIAVRGKIEAAYITENKKQYTQLAEDVMNFLTQTENNINKIHEKIGKK